MLDMLKTCWMVLRADKRGVTAVEYAVIAGVLVTTVTAAFTAFGGTLSAYFTAFKF